MSTQSKRFVFTVNNWTEEMYKQLVDASPKFQYIIFAKEVAPTTGTPHLQGYLETKKKCTFRGIHHMVGFKNMSLQVAKGTAADNDEYCSKERGDLWVHGTPMSQGERTDLKIAVLAVSKGTQSITDILLEDPMMYARYLRAFTAAEEVYLKTLKRTWMTKLIWVVGPTNSGKSHFAYSHDLSTFDYPYDNSGWCDEYQGQDVLVLNDFRGVVKYDTLLRWCDKWACSLPRRGKTPYPFMSKYVVVSSVLSPEECYHNRQDQDSIQQLLRRCTIVNLTIDHASNPKLGDYITPQHF